MSKHKIISFVKSGVRLVGFGLLTSVYFGWRTESFNALLMFHAFLFLFLAEILGIVEEFYETPNRPWYIGVDWAGENPSQAAFGHGLDTKTGPEV